MIRAADNFDYATLGHVVLGEPANTERNDIYRNLKASITEPTWLPLMWADCYLREDPQWRYDRLCALAMKMATIDTEVHRFIVDQATQMKSRIAMLAHRDDLVAHGVALNQPIETTQKDADDLSQRQ